MCLKVHVKLWMGAFSCALWSVSHHPVKIGDNKHSGSEDMFLICHVKEERDLIRRIPSRYVTTLPSLVAISTVVGGIML